MHSASSFRSAALAAVTLLAVAPATFAAPVAYEAAVRADEPFVHYRFDGATPLDVSANARHATYRATSPTIAAGAGIGSDGARTFTRNGYITASGLREFGASMGQSTYSFLFRTNSINSTGAMTLFGAFNSNDGSADIVGNVGVSVDLNLSATGGSVQNGTTRLFIRGADNRSVSATITNLLLRDGEYHLLTFTYDDRNADGVGNLIRAYVDGVPQVVSEINVNGTGVPTAYGNFEFDPAFAGRQNRASGAAVYDQLADVTLDETALFTVALTPAQVAAQAAAILVAAPAPEPMSLAGLCLFVTIAGRRRRA